jgi:hypothetical protein
MNPRAQFNAPARRLVQDIAAPTPKANPGPEGTELIKAEIEHNIPVKQQEHQQARASTQSRNPITAQKQFIENGEGKDDMELDNILKDVNHDIKNGNDKPAKRQKASRQNVLKRAKPAAKTGSHKPILLTAIVILVSAGLSVAAVYAFKETGSPSAAQSNTSAGTVGTRSASGSAVQAAGGTLVTPGDLSDLSNTLTSDINALNDTQDFNPEALSDQNLGL